MSAPVRLRELIDEYAPKLADGVTLKPIDPWIRAMSLAMEAEVNRRCSELEREINKLKYRGHDD